MADAFVTGGSGFIGSRLIERLVRDGNVVRALARSDSSSARVSALGAEPVRGDLSDRAAIGAGAEGCEVAYHAAAKVEDSGPWEEFERDTVEGTRNVVEACAEAGVRRFVHVGSEAAVNVGEPLVGIDETLPLRPDSPAPYPRSKALAEQIVVAANRDGFETVAVRPRFVWGKGDTSLLPEMVEMVESGKWAWVGGGTHLTSTAHVDNVVEAMILAAEKGRPGQAYYVTDGGSVVFRDFVTEMLRSQGVEPQDRTIPAALAKLVMLAGETAWKLLPLPGKVPLSRFAFWAATQECTIDDSKARVELGYEPIVSRADGLAEMAV